MIIRMLLKNLKLKGINIWVEEGKLKYKAPIGTMTDDIKALILENKTILLDALNPDKKMNLDAMIVDINHQDEPFSLTPIQTAYLLGRNTSFELGGVGAHYYCELLFKQGPDYNTFSNIITRLIDHYDALRLVITSDNQQKVLKTVPIYEPLKYDWSLSETLFETQLSELRATLSHHCYNPQQWPLFNFVWIKQPDNLIRILISIDLLIMDAMSGNNLIFELQACCHNKQYHLPAIPPLRDYAIAVQQWQAQHYSESMEYWQEKLLSLPPSPQLPRALTVDNNQPKRYSRLSYQLNSEQWKVLKKIAQSLTTTPTAILLTLFCRILAIWSTKSNFTVNITLFNRPNLHENVDKLWGELTTTSLFIYQDLSLPFSHQTREVQKQLMDCIENSAVSGVELIGLSQHHHPGKATMPIVFTSLLFESEHNITDAKEVYAVSQTPQVALDHQVYLREGKLLLNWDVAEGYFVENIIEDMFSYYSLSIEQLLKTSPDNIESLWNVKHFEYQSDFLVVREHINHTNCILPWQPLHQSFFRHANGQWANKIAVSSCDSEFTYSQLADYAKNIAINLTYYGVKPNQGVAIILPKGPIQIAAVLATLAIGAYYVPIAIDSPKQRKQKILMDANISAICIGTDEKQSLMAMENNWPLIICDNLTELSLENKNSFVVYSPSINELAYIIYTSGSTGQPKGVAITHLAASNTLISVEQLIDMTEDDVVYGLSALHFDLSVFDLFATLSKGAKLILPDSSRLKDPVHWLTQLEQYKVTIWNSVPMLADMLITYSEQQKKSLPYNLRVFLLSGDWIPLTLPDRLREHSPSRKIIGMGGATEASIWSNWFEINEIDPKWSSIPYGTPLLNQTLHILDSHLNARPDWVVGDLYIGGMGLAQEYFGDADKTVANFIIHPKTNERLYRTGDLARYWSDGTIEFLGREDNQVKLGGHRIELGEIESVLLRHPDIKQAIVKLSEEIPSSIIAWVVTNNLTLTYDKLCLFLAEWLPDYMLPRGIAFLSAVPLTANGKVDHHALAEIPLSSSNQNIVEDEYSPIEQKLCHLLGKILNQNEINPAIRFFEQGAGSMELVKFYSVVVSELGLPIDITDLFTYPSIRQIAKQLDARKSL